MKGFFEKEQVQSKSGIMRGYSCVTCGQKLDWEKIEIWEDWEDMGKK